MPGIQNAKDTLDFLGTIGSGKTPNEPLANTAKALVGLGEFMIKTASGNLQKKGHVASGKTISSMKLANLQTKGTNISLDIQIVDTYKFIDQGVKGTVSGKGKYSFKTSHPSKKMASEILKWATIRGLGGKIKYAPKGTNEAKNKGIHKTLSEATNKQSLSYAIATNIKKHGIDPTYFFSDALKATKKIMVSKLAQAFKVDIIQQL